MLKALVAATCVMVVCASGTYLYGEFSRRPPMQTAASNAPIEKFVTKLMGD
jgi:hypothetical protein